MFIEEERKDTCTKVEIKFTMHERLKLLFSDGIRICLEKNIDDPRIKTIQYHTEIDVIK